MGALHALAAAPWRVYPAAVLIALGAAVALRGLRGLCQPLRGPIVLLAWVRGFRLAVIGLALAGIGAAWLWRQPWILAIALGVGGEEFVESSNAIAALTRRRDAGAVGARPRVARPGG